MENLDACYSDSLIYVSVWASISKFRAVIWAPSSPDGLYWPWGHIAMQDPPPLLIPSYVYKNKS